MKRRSGNQNGFVLVTVILALLLISVLGIAIIRITTSTFKMTKIDSKSQSAYYIAESGINKAVDEIGKKAEDLSDKDLSKKVFFEKLDHFVLNDYKDKGLINILEKSKDNFEENLGEKPLVDVTVELDKENEDSNKNIRRYKINSIGKIGKSQRSLNTFIEIKINSLFHPAFEFAVYNGEKKLQLKLKDVTIDGDIMAYDMHINPHNNIKGDIMAHDIHINPHNNIVGDVYGINIKINPNTDIHGNVFDKDEIDLLSPDNPNYKKYKNLGTKVKLISVKSDYSGEKEIEVKKGNSPYTLKPGSYKELELEEKASLILSSGDYYFGEFDVGDDDNKKNKTRLTLDLSNGPINIYSKDEIEFEGSLVLKVIKDGTTYTIDDKFMEKKLDLAIEFAGEIYWETHEDFEIEGNNNFLGTILAKEEIEIEKGTRLVGSVISNGEDDDEELKFKNIKIIYAPPTKSAPTTGANNDTKVNTIKVEQKSIREN